jgi:hypothetical protein
VAVAATSSKGEMSDGEAAQGRSAEVVASFRHLMGRQRRAGQGGLREGPAGDNVI